jgi:hypothetical protein
MFSSATYQEVGSPACSPRRLARSAGCIAALVSLITLAACGGDGASTGPDTPRGEMPDDWVGQWQGAISGSPFLPNRLPGPAPDLTSLGSSVLGYAWAFGPEGEYEHVWRLDADYSFGACIVRLFWQEEGTATLSGTTLTLNPQSSKYIALDSCQPELAYDGPGGAKQQTFTATLESDEFGDPVLRLVYPDGNDLVLEKCESC